jgi:23S rRNA (uracil1939-C5)-methyltransferase
VVFVPGTVPGDRVIVRIEEEKRDWVRGSVHTFLAQSVDRQSPVCEVFGQCGGCQWQMMPYSRQLSAKEAMVRDAFQHVAHWSGALLPLEPIRPSLWTYHYRNKVQYPVQRVRGRLRIGYYAPRTHRVVDLEECPIEHPVFDWLLPRLRALLEEEPITIYDERRHFGKIRHLVLRAGVHTREVLVGWVVKEPAITRTFAEKILAFLPDRIVGVVENRNPRRTNVIFGETTQVIAGRGYYLENVLGMRFQVSLPSFFQVNVYQLEALLREWETHLPDALDVAVDAYAGVGVFAHFLARRARRVIAVEKSGSAIRDLEANVQRNTFPQIEVQPAWFEQYAPSLPRTPDLVFVDPPRSGLRPEALRAVMEARPRFLHYLSCNPVTLARDARILVEEGGYELVALFPYDFFPQTHHVETLALFRLK